MTEPVVDRREPVPIEKHHRDRMAEAAEARDLLLEPDGEEAPIVMSSDPPQ
jgi:hypothetical protein